MKNSDLPSLHGIKLRLRELTKAENNLIPRFSVQKATVLDAKTGGFIGKKRRYLAQETAVLEADLCFCMY